MIAQVCSGSKEEFSLTYYELNVEGINYNAMYLHVFLQTVVHPKTASSSELPSPVFIGNKTLTKTSFFDKQAYLKEKKGKRNHFGTTHQYILVFIS